jgi:hypothetical protein
MIQANINDRYAQLSQQEKAELIGIYTRAGYRDLASIIAHYNSCGGKLKADGGPITNTAQYKSDAYLYNPPVNVGAPIEVPLRYKPLPDYGDYVPQRTTGMLEDMPIELGLEMPQRGYGVLIPDAPSAMYTLDARQDAARRIMAVENSKNNANGGYDAKTGRWYPHKSHEGGADTIAYGIKLSNGTPEAKLALQQGYLTDEQAVSAVDTLVQKYYDAAKKVYDGKYGAGEWDKLSNKSQSILVDYSYNPGLSKFPSLMEGFHSGDLDLIKKNYKRYSGGKPLGRNKTLLEEIEMLGNEYPIFRKDGGSIHIKPSHRGRLTELKARTGKTEAELYNDGNPAHKKMVVFARNARKWRHEDGGPLDNYLYDGGPYGVIPLGGDYLTYLQTIPEVSGGSLEPAVVTAALPAKFNGSQAAAARYAEGYQKGAKPVSEAISRAGQDIFNTVDTVVGLTPTPAGAITWLGHMGADAAEGRWGRVGRDVALAAALGAGARGVSWLKNYVDDATNFGEDIFRAFTDSAPGRISTNFTYLAPATRASMEAAPVVSKAVSAPYEIENLGGGYMLKSLMHGNPLEKQISKSGTVNVNNVRALAGKGSKVEQAVIDKVLASDEFAGKKSIDYNRFRKAIQGELITYERTPDTRFENYGIDRLGLHDLEEVTSHPNVRKRFDEFFDYNVTTDGLDNYYLRGDLNTKMSFNDLASFYFKEVDPMTIPLNTAYPKTFTFSSSRIPNGSGKHYNPNTLGHSRTYTTFDEPNVLHVMESQSDWGQSYKKMNLDGEYNQKRINSLERRINNLKESINSEMEGLRTKKMNDGSDMSPWFADSLRGQIEKDKQLLEELTVEFDMRRNPKLATQQDYLAENFTSHQIQENLRYAAEKGQAKMRYPTRETAAKIEGYPEREAYFDASGRDITADGPVYTYGDDVDRRIAEINNRIDYLESEPGGEEAMAEYSSLLGERMRLLQGEAKLKPGITKKTVYDYEDILRKYTEFPRQYKKLYKNADVRIVTDPNGNTWYEVDVPENYLKQEWAYKNGGRLKEFNNISGIF